MLPNPNMTSFGQKKKSGLHFKPKKNLRSSLSYPTKIKKLPSPLSTPTSFPYFLQNSQVTGNEKLGSNRFATFATFVEDVEGVEHSEPRPSVGARRSTSSGGGASMGWRWKWNLSRDKGPGKAEKFGKSGKAQFFLKTWR